MANLGTPLRPLLRIDNERKKREKSEEPEREKEIRKIKQSKKKSCKKYIKRDLPLRVKCDASKKGLGVAFQQQQGGEWETTH